MVAVPDGSNVAVSVAEGSVVGLASVAVGAAGVGSWALATGVETPCPTNDPTNETTVSVRIMTSSR